MGCKSCEHRCEQCMCRKGTLPEEMFHTATGYKPLTSDSAAIAQRSDMSVSYRQEALADVMYQQKVQEMRSAGWVRKSRGKQKIIGWVSLIQAKPRLAGTFLRSKESIS